jgi:hypothetical protein
MLYGLWSWHVDLAVRSEIRKLDCPLRAAIFVAAIKTMQTIAPDVDESNC